jgi:hypothetical protein
MVKFARAEQSNQDNFGFLSSRPGLPFRRWDSAAHVDARVCWIATL